MVEDEDKDMVDVTNEDRAAQLKSIQAMSQSFLQLVIQVYLFVMLALMGGATLIAGVDAATYFKKICEFLSNAWKYYWRKNTYIFFIFPQLKQNVLHEHDPSPFQTLSQELP